MLTADLDSEMVGMAVGRSIVMGMRVWGVMGGVISWEGIMVVMGEVAMEREEDHMIEEVVGERTRQVLSFCQSVVVHMSPNLEKVDTGVWSRWFGFPAQRTAIHELKGRTNMAISQGSIIDWLSFISINRKLGDIRNYCILPE